MRRCLVVAMVCALVVLAFSATASAASVGRPFKGSLSGEVVFTPDPESPSPSGLWTDSTAVGKVSHLGKTVMTSRHPTPTGDIISGGNMKLIAANGDEVWMEYDGSAPFPVIGVPSTIVVDVEFTIVGGTGRFSDASGDGQMTAQVEFPGELTLGPWPASWAWKARIKY